MNHPIMFLDQRIKQVNTSFFFLLFRVLMRENSYNRYNLSAFWSFIKRQAGGTLSDNEWYNEWQRMTTSAIEWQRVV